MKGFIAFSTRLFPPPPFFFLFFFFFSATSLLITSSNSNALCAPLASDGSDSLPLSYPGAENLVDTIKGDFNDRLLSYQCFREEGYQVDPVEGGRAEGFEMAKAKTLAEVEG